MNSFLQDLQILTWKNLHVLPCELELKKKTFKSKIKQDIHASSCKIKQDLYL